MKRTTQRKTSTSGMIADIIERSKDEAIDSLGGGVRCLGRRRLHAEHLSCSVAQAYAHAAQMLGHEVVRRDLYRGGFDPRLREEETAVLVEQAVCDDIQAEQSLISDADVFAFIYPVWFNLPPAMVTGYVQRVFGPGFGYQSVHHRRPLLRGKSLLSFTSSSAPSGWLSNEGQWADLKHIFDNHLAEVCGLTQMGHFHFNNLTAETSPDLVKAHLSEVGEIFDRLFGPAGAERTGPRDGVS
jgi:NAD(P)H dehydrogenase (quinone)